MEKLLELLNEWSVKDQQNANREEFLTKEKNQIYLISKKFGFIKWLVENEKIKELGKFIGWETDEDEPYIQFDLVDQYIAYLAIQDNPIEFLVSILKDD